MRVLEYRTFQCRKLRFAVIAIHEAMIVLLMVYSLVHTSALRANIAVFVLCSNDKVNRTILVWKSFCKLKVCHSSYLLYYKGTKNISIIQD